VESGLEASPDADVKEHEWASFNCKAGHFLVNSKADNIWGGKFHVQCGADGNYAFDGTSWPVCQASVCTDLPEPDGFTLLSSGPIYGGGHALYKCATDGHITDTGPTFGVKCLPDGTFDEPDPWPSCALASECANDPPAPPPSSRLGAATTGADALEYGTADYPCAEGFVLSNGDEWFRLKCDDKSGSVAAFSTSPDWPECAVQTCSFNIPEGMRTSSGVTSGSYTISQGGSQSLQCQLNSQIVDGHGYTAVVRCEAEGINPDPAALSCVVPPTCTMNVPDPPTASKLTKVGGTLSKEHDVMTYMCAEGFTLVGTVNADDLDEDGNLKVTCDNGVSDYSFPTCLPFCVDYPVPTFESGLVAVDPSVKVAPLQIGLYRCIEEDEVPDLAVNPYVPHWGLLCEGDGKFEAPTWPTCRKVVSCPFPPVPPTAAVFQRSDGDNDIREYEMASYKCPTGFEMTAPYPPGFDPTDKKIYLK
jgi:hypothetical protein